MGKGTGKGKCGDDCCNVDAYKTDEGKCAAKAGLAGSILEGIGLVVNLYPACCVCCLMEGAVGVSGFPFCILILAGGIANFIGSIISCCKKSMCGLVTFTVTSYISLILRVVAMIVIGIVTKTVNEYCETDHDDDTFDKDDCESLTNKVLELLTTALVIIAIWLLVSLSGAVLGTRGTLVEPPESADSCKCPCGVQTPDSGGKHETVAVVVGEAAVTKEPEV